MTPFSGDIYVIASFFGGVGERLRFYCLIGIKSQAINAIAVNKSLYAIP
jgi:hypothetical protein